MDNTNSYNPYDDTIKWTPGQNNTQGQFYNGAPGMSPHPPQAQMQYPPTPESYQRPVQATPPGQQMPRTPRPSTPARMSKAQAKSMASSIKKGVVVASLVSFGTLSGLVATHLQAAASTQTQQSTPATNNQNTSPGSSSSSSTNSNPNDNSGSNQNSTGSSSGGFFNQQGGGGYGFGNGGSSQSPSTGSSVS